MALSADSVWEVRTAGNDTNGGGWVNGATGTDYSQQDSKNVAGADISTTDAVAVGSTTITSLTANFGTTIVGNIIYLQGGTGALAAGRYEVTARASSTSITVDRTVAAGTGITMNIGGAVANLETVSNGVQVIGNTIWMKAGTYTRTATTTVNGGAYYTSAARGNRILGYNAARGDVPTGSNRPLISLSTNTGLFGIDITDGSRCENIRVDCNSLGTSTGIRLGLYTQLSNCSVREFTSIGMEGGGSNLMTSCEATAGTAAAAQAFLAGTATILSFCWAHDNACSGFESSTGVTYERCVSSNNTGATSDGFRLYFSNSVFNCIAHGNGRDGVLMGAFDISNTVFNTIFTSNVGYGINFPGGLSPASPYYDYNAYFNNTAGERNGLDDTGGSHTGVVYPLSNVTLAGDPYTNAAGNDFTLNNTAGAGAAARAAGYFGTPINGLTGTGYLDIGALQSQAAAGGGGPPYIIGG